MKERQARKLHAVLNRKHSGWGGLALVCALGVAACGGSSTPTAKTHTIAMVMAQLPSTFDGPIVKGVKDEAAKLGNITVNAQGPNQQSATAQVPFLVSTLATHPDALIIHPADPQALLGSLSGYFNANIPVMTTLSSIPSDKITAGWIGDYTAEGHDQADAMCTLMGGKGVVQLMQYDLSDPAGVNRVTGFKAEMAIKCPTVTFLPPDVTGPNSTIAAAHAKADLIAHPNITGFFANGSLVGIGVIAGVGDQAAAGKLFIGTDGGDAALINSMNQGRVQVLSCDDTYQEGVAAVDALAAIWAGKTVSKTVTNLNEDVTFTKGQDTNTNVTDCISRAVA
jgi:ribose transport system substrate-binding protein